MTDREKLEAIMRYLKPHLRQMWAARIAGIIMDCDFRDVQAKMREKRKEELRSRG